MPVLTSSQLAGPVQLAARHILVRRKNWARRNSGVVVVFAIVGALAILLLVLFIYRKLQARKAARAQQL